MIRRIRGQASQETPAEIQAKSGPEEEEDAFQPPENQISVLDVGRLIEINREIDEKTTSLVYTAVQHYAGEDDARPITLILNSPGGDVDQVLAIWRLLKEVRQKLFPVRTICNGVAFSGAALLLAAGSVGHRYAHPGSNLLAHGVQWSMHLMEQGHQAKLKPWLQYIDRVEDEFLEAFVYETGKRVSKRGKELPPLAKKAKQIREELVAKMALQDIIIPAEKALEMGFVDHVSIPLIIDLIEADCTEE